MNIVKNTIFSNFGNFFTEKDDEKSNKQNSLKIRPRIRLYFFLAKKRKFSGNSDLVGQDTSEKPWCSRGRPSATETLLVPGLTQL